MPELKEYARYIFGTLISILLILFGVRPLVNHLIRGKNNSQAPALAQTSEASSANKDVKERQSTPLDEAISSDSKVDDLTSREGNSKHAAIALPQIGNDFEEQIAHMQLLASRETERVTSVIKYWVEQGVEIESRKG